MLTMKPAVKAMDIQRWTCRIHLFQFIASSSSPSSIDPRQYLVELRQELLPSDLRAAEGLRLVRPEARLLHAQARPLVRRGEREGHHALQIEGGIVVREVPAVGQ